MTTRPDPPSQGFFTKIARDFGTYSRRASSRPAGVWVALTALGFHVTVLYRVSALLDSWGPLGTAVSRVLDLFTNILSGCYISPRARIGAGLYLPHPTGVVIGKGVVVGDLASIFQNVTLGSRGAGAEAYPVLGDGVTLYANAIVVGDVLIGANAVIGAGAVVFDHVPAGGRAVGNPARVKA